MNVEDYNMNVEDHNMNVEDHNMNTRLKYVGKNIYINESDIIY